MGQRKYYKRVAFVLEKQATSPNGTGAGLGKPYFVASAGLKLYRDSDDPTTLVAETTAGHRNEYPWSSVREAVCIPPDKK